MHPRFATIEHHFPQDFTPPDYQEIPTEEILKFFALQEKIEKDLSQGGMDYFRFSMELWHSFFGVVPCLDDSIYREFEAVIVLGLQKFTTRELIYPDIKQSLSELVRQLYPVVERVVLWSRGDVKQTGYQTAKMTLSGLRKNWLQATIQAFGKNGARGYLSQDKTSIIIGEEKDQALSQLVKKTMPKRMVVVEDSLENLANTRKLAQSHSIPYIGVWAAYSREGGAISESDAYNRAVREWEVLRSPSELVQFAQDPSLIDAMVVVDFDGVIGDNEWMRRQQSRVFWGAIQTARSKKVIAQC